VESVTHIFEVQRKLERRRYLRIHTDQPASMRLVDSWSRACQEIRVLDASTGGLKLRVPKFLDRGTLLQIHLQGLAPAGLSPSALLAVAEVRYCLNAGDDFHAGVLFHELFPD